MDASQLISGPDPYEDERYNPDERKKDDEGIEDGKDTDPEDKPAPENPEDEGGSPVVVILIIIVVILIVGGVAFRCK